MATPAHTAPTTTAPETIQLTVRFFAAARAAAGAEVQTISAAAGTTVQRLADELGRDSAELARVLPRCSYLCDGIAVRDLEIALRDGQTVDVLPPFAGG